MPNRYRSSQVRRALSEAARARISPRPTPRPPLRQTQQIRPTARGIAREYASGRPGPTLGYNFPTQEYMPPGEIPPTTGATPTPSESSTTTPIPAPGQGGGPLSWNPQLVTHPLGRFTDAQYELDVGQLQHEATRKYQDVLSRLGYTDPQGRFIRGSEELAAERSRTDINRALGLARQDVTQQQRDFGTLFSGLRGVAQARAEHPFVQQLSDIDINLPQKLSGLTGEARDILTQFEYDRDRLLLEAAGRYDPMNPVGALPTAAGPPPPGAGSINPTPSLTLGAPGAGTRRIDYAAAARRSLFNQAARRQRGRGVNRPRRGIGFDYYA